MTYLSTESGTRTVTTAFMTGEGCGYFTLLAESASLRAPAVTL